MAEADIKLTHYFAAFAGERRKFELRLGDAEDLEQKCNNSGIGAIMLRLSTHQFFVADIRSTIFYGLIGGGMPEPEATRLVTKFVDGTPLAQHIELAANIVGAFANGIDPKDPGAKKDEAGSEQNPASSLSSTAPGE
jgi:hypothetical protein